MVIIGKKTIAKNGPVNRVPTILSEITPIFLPNRVNIKMGFLFMKFTLEEKLHYVKLHLEENIFLLKAK